MLIQKHQEGKSLIARNDAIRVKPIKIKPITGYYQKPNSDLIHEVTVDPETGRFGIGVGYPKLTELQQKDKSAIERLYNRPYTNRQFLNLQRRIHNSNVRDIDSATKATGAIMTLASMLSGAARFGGNPGITSSGVKLIPALDPGNIAGYANAAGLIKSDPKNAWTYVDPDVWSAAIIPTSTFSNRVYNEIEDLRKNAAVRRRIYLTDPKYRKAMDDIEDALVLDAPVPKFDDLGAEPSARQVIEAQLQQQERGLDPENTVWLAGFKGQSERVRNNWEGKPGSLHKGTYSTDNRGVAAGYGYHPDPSRDPFTAQQLNIREKMLSGYTPEQRSRIDELTEQLRDLYEQAGVKQATTTNGYTHVTVPLDMQPFSTQDFDPNLPLSSTNFNVTDPRAQPWLSKINELETELGDIVGKDLYLGGVREVLLNYDPSTTQVINWNKKKYTQKVDGKNLDKYVKSIFDQPFGPTTVVATETADPLIIANDLVTKNYSGTTPVRKRGGKLIKRYDTNCHIQRKLC